MAVSRKISQLTTAISLLLLFVFSLSKAWQTVNNLQVLGEEDRRGFEQVLVSRVIDGDTVQLSDGRKIRYIGIDTPETSDPHRPDGCFGEEAKQANQRLVEGKTVYLEKDVSDTDRYGRILRYVWLDQQTMLNEQLVAQGYASAVSYPPDVKYQEKFRIAQRQAQENQLGLWASCQLPELTPTVAAH